MLTDEKSLSGVSSSSSNFRVLLHPLGSMEIIRTIGILDEAEAVGEQRDEFSSAASVESRSIQCDSSRGKPSWDVAGSVPVLSRVVNRSSSCSYLDDKTR